MHSVGSVVDDALKRMPDPIADKFASVRRGLSDIHSLVFLIGRDVASRLPGDTCMKPHADFIGRAYLRKKRCRGTPRLMATVAAIGLSSLPLYIMDYHRGALPILGVGLAVVLGAAINAVFSVRSLDPVNRPYLLPEYGRMLALLGVMVAWSVLYFGLLAPAAAAGLSLEPEVAPLASNTYGNPLKPIAHITAAFAVWGGFQLVFVARACRARRLDDDKDLRVVDELARFDRNRPKSMQLVLMMLALGALYSWLLVPCLFAVIQRFHRYQRRLV
jgi:hypothetical protein